ncbi:MAG: C-terminal target protein [Chitinophagaceae bacterium]|nr:C-terminal target protein [Chitinophagaceae bacterium]
MKRLFISVFISSHFFQLSAQPVQSSDPVINKLPVVSINAPSNGTTFTAPASFSLNAIASDEDGIAKVDFFSGTVLLGSTTTSPYSFNWSNVPEGIYKVSAKATDNLGESTVSAVVVLIVTRMTVNQLPTIVLTAPVNNSTANAPANITMSADAVDADGFISRVEFYNGTLLLGVDNTAPYNYVWSGVGAGVYHLTAKAVDNQGSSKVSPVAVVTLLSVMTDVCSGLAMYIENGGYVGGSKVKNTNGRYECKSWPYSGWCNGAAWAYAPGEGAYWMDAWTFVGSCNSTAVKQSIQADVLEELTIVPNPVVSAATLHLVLKESDQVSIKLYDKYSQYIQTIVEGDFVAGFYDFPLNLEGVQRGTYLLKSITHSDSKVIRIEKTE